MTASAEPSTATSRPVTSASQTQLPPLLPVLTRTFRIAARRSGANRVSLAMTGVIYLFVLIAISSLWMAIAGSETIAGYDRAMVFWYMAATEIGAIAVPIRLLEKTGNQIGNGEIATEMVRPISPLPIRVASELGDIAPRLVVCGGLGLIAGLIQFGFPPNGWAAALAIPSLALAAALSIINQHLFAAAAFWLRDAGSAWFIHQKLWFILGGLLIPFQVLPTGLRTVAWLTPFPLMAYAPARLSAGFFEPWLLLAQAAWILVISLAALSAFRRGQDRFVRTGG